MSERARRLFADLALPVLASCVVSGIGGMMLVWRTQETFGARQEAQERRLDSLERTDAALGELLRQIREDVAFIRGQLERR